MSDPAVGDPRPAGRSVRRRGDRLALAIVALGVVVLLAALGSSRLPTGTAPLAGSSPATSASTPPDWFDTQLVDVRTGATFSMNDHTGQVVLLETMAQWCPTCVQQQAEMRRLRDLLGDPDDLVLVSLDVDPNEDASSLEEYTAMWGYDWHFAVAPLLVARALGNLYSAQYLNPPLAPMLVIDRRGTVIQLPFGLKRAERLRELVGPYLAG